MKRNNDIRIALHDASAKVAEEAVERFAIVFERGDCTLNSMLRAMWTARSHTTVTSFT